MAQIGDLLPLRNELATAVQQLTAGEHQPAAERLRAVLAELELHLLEPTPLPALEIDAAVQV